MVLIQLVSITSFGKEVGDIKGFSQVGWYYRHEMDIYQIDRAPYRYPFFPFLIPVLALGNFLAEKIPFFPFSFYLKLLLFPDDLSIID